MALDSDRVLQIVKEQSIPIPFLCSAIRTSPVAFGRYLLEEGCPIKVAQSLAIVLRVELSEIIKGVYR